MNPLYGMYMGGMPQQPIYNQQPMPMGMPANPIQRMQMVMQAMQNPIGYLKQKFPDIPDNISGNPGQILQYLQQTRNITNDQIQQTMQQIPR